MYMPLMVDIKKAVVFGGERGEGLQKVQKLAVYADELLCVPEAPGAPAFIDLKAGPQPLIEPTLHLKKDRRIEVAGEVASLDHFEKFLDGATFVSSDLKDRALNAAILAACQRRGILCNIIDTKDLCNTWFMSLIGGDHLQVAISSQGGCAFYSAQTRRELEPQMADRDRVSAILTNLRAQVQNPSDRMAVLDQVYRDFHFQRHIKAHRWAQAAGRAGDCLRRFEQKK